MASGYRVSVDAGGTFSDFVIFDEATGKYRILKVPSTPDDPARAILSGLDALTTAGVDLHHVTFFWHGTTVATNALLEERGARVGLAITAGFRGIYETMEQSRPFGPAVYDLAYEKPRLLAPESRTAEIVERIGPQGQVRVPLDERSIQQAIELFETQGVESVATCFLFSFMNSTHERRVRDALASAHPEWWISASSDLLPQIREYYRLSTTVVNAYVAPVLGRYLRQLTGQLDERGVACGRRFSMQSNGGSSTIEAAADRAVTTILSGPAGGVTAGAALASAAGFDNVITFDMGGTSCDVALIQRGEPVITDRSKAISTERGFDLREFTLLPFGGAGPVHACQIALDLGIPRLLVPPVPGATSALGLLMSDVKHDVLRSRLADIAELPADEATALFRELEDAGCAQLAQEGFAPDQRRFRYFLDMRYAGQGYENPVPVNGVPVTAADLRRYRAHFDDIHKLCHGHAAPGQPVEVVNYRVDAIGLVPHINLRVRALCAKHGASTVGDAARQLYLLTEKRVRAAVAEWPDGEYTGQAVLHDAGVENARPVHVRVRATIRGDQVTFDFRESDDQVSGPFNIRPPLVRAVCSYALKCLIDADLPTNHGLTAAVETITRPGSVLSPNIPAPVNTYMPIANTTAEAIFDALSTAVPRAGIAGSSFGISGTLSHTSTRSSSPQVQYELPAGAIGARVDRDGVSASKAHVANGTITSVEIIESEFPVELTRFELIPDSGGAGKYRGGLGYVREYRMLGESQLSARGGKLLSPPPGRNGGLSGRLPALIVNPGKPDERVVDPKDGNVRLHPGDILRREQSGSGGFGDPFARDPERVLDDVKEGYVSASAARDQYGVAVVQIGGTCRLDAAETASLRRG